MTATKREEQYKKLARKIASSGSVGAMFKFVIDALEESGIYLQFPDEEERSGLKHRVNADILRECKDSLLRMDGRINGMRKRRDLAEGLLATVEANRPPMPATRRRQNNNVIQFKPRAKEIASDGPKAAS